MNSATILQNLPSWLQATVLVLGVLSTLATAIAGLFALLAKLFPSVAFFDSAAKGSAVAGLDLAAVGSWLGGMLGAKKPAAPNGFVRMRALVALALIASLALFAPIGCAWWNGGGKAIVVSEGEKVIAEALEGKSVLQIAEDLGIDALAVIADLLKAGVTVQHTAAYAEALKERAMLLALPVPDGGV